MPRVHRLTDDELDEIEEGQEVREVIRLYRWSFFDREGVDPAIRAKGRAMADQHLRERGLLPPE